MILHLQIPPYRPPLQTLERGNCNWAYCEEQACACTHPACKRTCTFTSAWPQVETNQNQEIQEMQILVQACACMRRFTYNHAHTHASTPTHRQADRQTAEREGVEYMLHKWTANRRRPEQQVTAQSTRMQLHTTSTDAPTGDPLFLFPGQRLDSFVRGGCPHVATEFMNMPQSLRGSGQGSGRGHTQTAC